MRAVSPFRAVLLLAATLSLTLTACDTLIPTSETADALARKAKVDVCHLDEDAATYDLIQIAAPAVDAHLAHGDGLVGDAVPGQDGAVFDEACQPEIVVTEPIAACYTDNEDNSLDVLVDLGTGDLTATEPCSFFGGNCEASGTVTPVGVDTLGAVTGFALTETNTLADQDGGGCDAGGPDVVETTFMRIEGDLFAGQALAFCDGQPLDSGFSFEATLSEGACATASRAAADFRPVMGSKSSWIQSLR